MYSAGLGASASQAHEADLHVRCPCEAVFAPAAPQVKFDRTAAAARRPMRRAIARDLARGAYPFGFDLFYPPQRGALRLATAGGTLADEATDAQIGAFLVGKWRW